VCLSSALISPRHQSDVLTNQVPVILFTILQTQGSPRGNPPKFGNLWKPSTTFSFGSKLTCTSRDPPQRRIETKAFEGFTPKRILHVSRSRSLFSSTATYSFIWSQKRFRLFLGNGNGSVFFSWCLPNLCSQKNGSDLFGRHNVPLGRIFNRFGGFIFLDVSAYLGMGLARQPLGAGRADQPTGPHRHHRGLPPALEHQVVS